MASDIPLLKELSVPVPGRSLDLGMVILVTPAY